MFGSCYDGKDGMQNMIGKSVRPLFEKLVSNARQAGSGDAFKLPKMTDLEPAVWEQLERVITKNQKITKCGACKKKFDAKSAWKNTRRQKRV